MKKNVNYVDIDRSVSRGKKPKLRKKKSRWLMYSAIISAIAIVAFIGFVLPVVSKFALLDVFLTLTPASNLISETNILVLGVDSNRGTHRSDTIMVAKIDPLEKETKLLSIPRDTIVVIPGRGLDKVNHAFAYGGIELSRSTISRFLEIPIPYYVMIDIGGLEDLIDKLGGITINVEKRMYYVDYAGGLFVDLKPGRQKLNGREAVGYIRFRHDKQGDIGRIKRQQKFLRAFAKQFSNRTNILKSPGLLLSFLSGIQTNLNFKEIVGLALAVRGAHDLGRIEMASLPGRDLMIDDVYYWRADWAETKGLVNRILKTNGRSGSRVAAESNMIF